MKLGFGNFLSKTNQDVTENVTERYFGMYDCLNCNRFDCPKNSNYDDTFVFRLKTITAEEIQRNFVLCPYTISLAIKNIVLGFV